VLSSNALSGSFQDASHALFNDDKAIGHDLLDRQYHEYARAMARAKIVLVSGSVNNYALRKYTEAALAGALLIGDIPCERSAEFREYVVEVLHLECHRTVNPTALCALLPPKPPHCSALLTPKPPHCRSPDWTRITPSRRWSSGGGPTSRNGRRGRSGGGRSLYGTRP
jgi:hypothetical protein